MRYFLVTVLCAVTLKNMVDGSENAVKRNVFPFMAFLYYTDELILDNDTRFTRSAVLISPDTLISSGDVSVEFPQKTLIARLGADVIDSKFTPNEDDGEQEREVITILRPRNISKTEWWKSDISLLKTLLPFNVTSSVAPATLLKSFDIILKDCYILVYSRRDNMTERALTPINVKLFPPKEEQCGKYFKKETMVCGESDKTNAIVESDFCKGNRGGPLVCDNLLVGTQTYIKDCQPPHLYQLVLGWSGLISCASEQQSQNQLCSSVSIAINKDSPPLQADIPKVVEIINDMLGDKLFSQTDAPETVNNHNTQEPDSTTVSKIATIKEAESEMSSAKEQDTSEITDNYSHSTPATSTAVTESKDAEENAAEEKAAAESTTAERDRPNLIEAKHELVHGEASVNIPFLFHYLLASFHLLAYN